MDCQKFADEGSLRGCRGKRHSMTPLVSVIVPVFNVLPYLREALDSVVDQTYDKLEILIVDDGSTDGSSGICDEYGRDPRVRIIHQANQGLSAARNAGLDRMTGDAVVFLDSDDAFFPDSIRTMVTAMQRHSADVVMGGHVRCRTAKRMGMGPENRILAFRTEEYLSSREVLAGLAEGRLRHCVWGKLYVRGVWDALRFPEGRLYEDLSTTYRAISRAKGIVAIPGQQVMHRIRPGSITQTKTAKGVRDRMDAYAHFERFVEEHVPALFHDDQLRCVRKRKLMAAFADWCRLPWKEQRQSRDVRATLLENRALILEGARLRWKAAFCLLLLCPLLLPLVHSAYRVLKRLVRG